MCQRLKDAVKRLHIKILACAKCGGDKMIDDVVVIQEEVDKIQEEHNERDIFNSKHKFTV